MNCVKCGKSKVLVESLDDGRTKQTCQECGYARIVDSKGRQMLTDSTGENAGGRQYLTEG